MHGTQLVAVSLSSWNGSIDAILALHAEAAVGATASPGVSLSLGGDGSSDGSDGARFMV